jgi:hypothetical protein
MIERCVSPRKSLQLNGACGDGQLNGTVACAAIAGRWCEKNPRKSGATLAQRDAESFELGPINARYAESHGYHSINVICGKGGLAKRERDRVSN